MEAEPVAYLDLASKPRPVGSLTSRAIEHFVLVVPKLWELVQELRSDIDMAGRAHGLPATFADDAVNSIADSGMHQRCASGNFKALFGSVRLGKSY